jgi:hypothetical protein
MSKAKEGFTEDGFKFPDSRIVSIDEGLGLNTQAWDVYRRVVGYKFLQHQDSTLCCPRVQVKTFYNCREAGFAFIVDTFGKVEKDKPVARVLTVAEHRSSDSIVVMEHDGERPFNEVTVDYFTDEDYRNTKFFGCGKADDAARYIGERILDFFGKSEMAAWNF